MFSLIENILILLVTLSTSLAAVALLNRVWPLERRQHRNDQIGWQLSVLGTTYAVLLGFMLYTVWTNFGSAKLNVELEASALRNLNRLAQALPSPAREALLADTKSYAAAVIEYDWPDMASGRSPERSHAINETVWRKLLQLNTLSPLESIAADHALTELSDLTARRRTRLLQSSDHLPLVLWCVLLTGAALTLVSVNMFGSISPKLHMFQVFSLTLLITLAILAIADIDQPFQGWIHVDDYAFRRALEYMQGN